MKNFINYTLVFALALTFGWAIMETREYINFGSETPEVRAEESEWCLIDILENAGGQIVTHEAGSNTYRIIASVRGYEVYQKCGKD